MNAMQATRTVTGPGYELREYQTPEGCRVRADVTLNRTTGLVDETVVLSCPVPLQLGRLPEYVLSVRRRRRGA